MKMSNQQVSDARMKGFEPFRKPFETLGIDWSAVLALPDEEFTERYLGEMTRYFFEHGRHLLQREAYERSVSIKRGLNPIGCSDCSSPIESPRDLRRYYGASLHHTCFVKRWGSDKGERIRGNPSSVILKYRDRVANLSL